MQRSNPASSSRYTAALQGSWTPTTGPSTPGGPSSTYHGPTSASHDGAVHERRNHRWFTAEREALMPNLLFAAAARQRKSWHSFGECIVGPKRVVFADHDFTAQDRWKSSTPTSTSTASIPNLHGTCWIFTGTDNTMLSWSHTVRLSCETWHPAVRTSHASY